MMTILPRYFIGGLFVLAGFQKIVDPSSFARAISNYQLLPDSWPALLAFYLPWLEVVLGGAFLFPRFERGANLGLVGLCFCFLGALLSAWIRGLDISCGCFGKIIPVKHYQGMILFDSILLLALLGLWFFSNHQKRSE